MNHPSTDLLNQILPQFAGMKLDITTCMLGMIGVLLIMICFDKLREVIETNVVESNVYKEEAARIKRSEVRLQLKQKRNQFYQDSFTSQAEVQRPRNNKSN